MQMKFICIAPSKSLHSRPPFFFHREQELELLVDFYRHCLKFRTDNGIGCSLPNATNHVISSNLKFRTDNGIGCTWHNATNHVISSKYPKWLISLQRVRKTKIMQLNKCHLHAKSVPHGPNEISLPFQIILSTSLPNIMPAHYGQGRGGE